MVYADGPNKPKFGSDCRIFELDSGDNYGRVCLVYREGKESSGMPEIRYMKKRVNEYMTE